MISLMTDQQLDALIDRQIEQLETWFEEQQEQHELEELEDDEMVMVNKEFLLPTREELFETFMYNKATHD